MDVAAFRAARTPADHRATYDAPVEQVYPPFALDADTSRSRYRHHGSGRGLDYYAVDENLRHALRSHLSDEVLRWADGPLHELGELAGTELVRRADVYDAVGHELVRYDKLGRDVGQVRYHPDWLTSLNEVFDFGLVGWNHDPERLARHGRAPYPLLAAFDYTPRRRWRSPRPSATSAPRCASARSPRSSSTARASSASTSPAPR